MSHPLQLLAWNDLTNEQRDELRDAAAYWLDDDVAGGAGSVAGAIYNTIRDKVRCPLPPLLSRFYAVQTDPDSIAPAAPVGEGLDKMFTLANTAAGYPSDDEDQSLDAQVGREFITHRMAIAAALASRAAPEGSLQKMQSTPAARAAPDHHQLLGRIGYWHEQADRIASERKLPEEFTTAEWANLCADLDAIMVIVEAVGRYATVGAEAVAQAESDRANWPPYNSAHEGFAVINEEFDELKVHVWTNQKRRDIAAMRAEAIQLAACAIAFAADICTDERGRR